MAILIDLSVFISSSPVASSIALAHFFFKDSVLTPVHTVTAEALLPILLAREYQFVC
jgi:hypothetical protein